MNKSILIIGGGTSSYYISKNLRKNGFTQAITIVSEESYVPYNRMLLPRLLKEEINIEKVFFEDQQWYLDNNIELIGSRTIVFNEDNNTFEVGQSDIINDPKGLNFKVPSQFAISKKSPEKAISQLLEDKSVIKIVASGGDPFVPGIYPKLPQVKTWRTLDDTFVIRDILKNHKQSIALIGGSFISMELAMAAEHFNANYEWIIQTKGFLRDSLDSTIQTKLKDNWTNNRFRKPSFESEIKLSDNNITMYNGNEVMYTSILLGTGIKSSIPISKKPIKSGDSYYAGDMVSLSFCDNIVSCGSINQAVKIALYITKDIIGEIRIENEIDLIAQDIALTPYQIKFAGLPIRLAGLIDNKGIVSETTTIEGKITQSWFSTNKEVKAGYCIV